MMLRLVKMIILIGLVSPLAAQQMNSPVEMDRPSGLELSQEQEAAVLKIEKEFQAREKRAAANDRVFTKDLAAREKERAEKIKKILSPAQWEEYQKRKFH